MGNNKLVQRETLIPFILLTSLFAWWGLANNMTDTLLAAFKKIKSMSDFQTSLIQMAFYGAYFCFALPAAIFVTRFTYKSGVLLGLALFIIGGLLFYPSSISMQYGHFLVSLYILAAGLSVLETSANPYILVMGPPETATQRLNLAQSFNPIGSILGVLISKVFILSNLNAVNKAERMAMPAEELRHIQSEELTAVMNPYVTVAFILLIVWIAIAFLKMPREKDTRDVKIKASLSRLLKNKNYMLGVLAQFFYIGAQIGIWSYTIRYVMQELGINEAAAASYYLASLGLFALFRFISTLLMSYIKPVNLLALLSVIAALLVLIVMNIGGMTGVISLVLISACMSLMFPTIYGLALENAGEDTKIGGSGLIMAILGGAALTAVQGIVSDNVGINFAFIVPLCCFLVVFGFAFVKMREIRNA
jgi:FHS family L-fucose permease-like MFS transporter